MRIISFIEDAQVIRDILTHLGLWLVRSRPPPKIHDPPNIECAAADYLAHPPHPQTDCYADPEIEDSAKLIRMGRLHPILTS